MTTPTPPPPSARPEMGGLRVGAGGITFETQVVDGDHNNVGGKAPRRKGQKPKKPTEEERQQRERARGGVSFETAGGERVTLATLQKMALGLGPEQALVALATLEKMVGPEQAAGTPPSSPAPQFVAGTPTECPRAPRRGRASASEEEEDEETAPPMRLRRTESMVPRQV